VGVGQGEAYTLMFRFPSMYPIESPAVQFLVDQTRQSPVHPVRNIPDMVLWNLTHCIDQHVYSNGHVRLLCSWLIMPVPHFMGNTDMRLHPWIRLVSGIGRCFCVCYVAEYAGFVQGAHVPPLIRMKRH
jgi:hypothetical protein